MAVDLASVESFLHAGDVVAARGVARELSQNSSVRQTKKLLKVIEDCMPEESGLSPLKVAFLSSFSIELVHDAFYMQSFIDGYELEIYQSGFAQFAQEIIDENSGLYTSKPDFVVLALEGRDVVPDLYDDFTSGSPTETANRFVDDLRIWLDIFRSRSTATLLMSDFARPSFNSMGTVDAQILEGQIKKLEVINGSIRAVVGATSGAYMLDYSGLVNRFGANHWYDVRMDLYAHAPIAGPMLPHLAGEYFKLIRAVRGNGKKCVVLDMDNTLWGGILGEDGVDGINLGASYPGNAFSRFQKALKGLSRRGIMLAAASKNNPQDVDEVFAKQNHMVLEKDDFVAMEVHWNPKSESIKSIASDLNIGLGQIVFVDDSGFECEEVRAALPEVTVIHLNGRPETYIDQVVNSGLFDGVSVTAEDANRADLYRTRAEGEKLRRSTANLEDFYRDLELTVTVKPVDESSFARVAQLTQKTNQFNATTRRYSEAEIRSFAADPEWICLAIEVADRFGDHGLVAVALAEFDSDVLRIDTFLMSCRVIGRTVETAILGAIFIEGKELGARSIIGEIIETKKNPPVRDFYERHGFVPGETLGDLIRWQTSISEAVTIPDWINFMTIDTRKEK